MSAPGKEWWRGAVFYQIYPRSYKDTTGDGIGDLRGVREKLLYIAALGVDAIWLCPCFQSPMKDFGYDISDYRAIDPLFGTLEDFDALLGAAHDHGLKLIVDQVYNHTSDVHPWFLESRRDRANPKADWYVWADPVPGNPGEVPNNWASIFGGPAWTYEKTREQFYFHNFLKEQPDLNYHNPAVQDAILDTAEFWLKRGADGLRLDVINFCFHDKQLRDNPPKKDKTRFATQLEIEDDPYNAQEHVYDKSRPEMLPFLARLRTLTDRYPGTMLLGEIGDDDPVARAAQYTDDPDRLHTAYSFSLMAGAKRELSTAYIRDAVTAHLAQPGESWPSWAFSNHDVVRALTRFGATAESGPALAKLLVALLCSLRGTAFLYQGEELGLPEARIPEDIPPEKMQDPWGIALYPAAPGRDGCRTPMPWQTDAPQCGFSNAPEPWLPLPASHRALSVAVQESDPASPLHFTRVFLTWRKEHSCLITGEIEFTESEDEHLLGFIRRTSETAILCMFNLENHSKTVPCPQTNSLFAFPGATGQYDPETGSVFLPPYGMFFATL